MATSTEVLSMLIPTGGWVAVGDDWDGVRFIEATPITKEQFNAGIIAYDAWKIGQDAQSTTDKQNATAKLEALGLTANDLKALGL